MLRFWRQRRGTSQLELATATGVSTEHLSFVENEWSRPSRQLRLVVYTTEPDSPTARVPPLLAGWGAGVEV